MAPLYVRGLLGPGEAKSIQPMAQRLGLPGHDQLHHFVTSPAWDDAPLWRVLAQQADQQFGGRDAVLVVDGTGMPKKGTASVGVAPQYCGELGKTANCQVLVSLTLARGEVPVPVGLRLFLPSSWIDDPDRCAAAGVPQTAQAAQTKPAIALAEIDRLIAAGLRFGSVLSDAGYGQQPDVPPRAAGAWVAMGGRRCRDPEGLPDDGPTAPVAHPHRAGYQIHTFW